VKKIKLRFVQWWYKVNPGKYCWADCVSFVFSPKRFNPFKIDKATCCKEESIQTEGMCYCGQFNYGICFQELSKQEKEQMITDRLKAQELIDELPF
jgi:hypothetical protein